MEDNNISLEENTAKASVSDEKKLFLSNLRTVAITVVAMLLFIYFVAQMTIVRGDSMMPTLHNRDLCVMEKISTRFGHLKRNDVIVFDTHIEGKEFFIKRIIGLPGETVYINPDGDIFINGELYADDYGAELITNPGQALDGVTLGEDEYFVMGDNRNNSNDSRFIGPVKKKDVWGHVVVDLVPGRNPNKIVKK